MLKGEIKLGFMVLIFCMSPCYVTVFVLLILLGFLPCIYTLNFNIYMILFTLNTNLDSFIFKLFQKTLSLGHECDVILDSLIRINTPNIIIVMILFILGLNPLNFIFLTSLKRSHINRKYCPY